jgi:hypothetical protein
MNVSISARELPVKLSPEKQMTASSWLPPLGTPATDWISRIGPCSVPLNAEVTLSAAIEMLKVVPSALTARKTAEPWNPAGQPVVVDQVGVLFVEPLAGFSATAPGSVPKADWAPCASCAAYPPSSTPPTTTAPAIHPAIERAFLLNTGSLPSTGRPEP